MCKMGLVAQPVKNLSAMQETTGLIPGSGRSPGEGNSSPLQYSCLENSMDRGAWQATVRRVARVARDLATKPKRYNLLVQIMRTLYINFIGRLRCNLAPKLRNNEMEVEVKLYPLLTSIFSCSWIHSVWEQVLKIASDINDCIASMHKLLTEVLGGFQLPLFLLFPPNNQSSLETHQSFGVLRFQGIREIKLKLIWNLTWNY